MISAREERIPLSGSTDGRPIKVVAIATPGTLVHTACRGAAQTTIDEVHLWVANQTAIAATLTLEWGGVVAPDDHVTTATVVAANTTPQKIADGLVLRNELIIRAFSGTANALTIFGYVNRIARVTYPGKVGGAT